MKINLQLLHLSAAIFNKDPLDMLVSWSLQTKDQLKENGRRLDTLKGVMPDPIFEQLLIFLAELVNNRGGQFQFIFTNDPKKINPAITKWTALISEDTSWLNRESTATEGAPMSTENKNDPIATEGCAAAAGYVVPSKPGYYWLRHATPLAGRWQPVMVDTVHGVLGFKKFGWDGSMAISESLHLGIEWGGECLHPHTNQTLATASEPPPAT